MSNDRYLNQTFNLKGRVAIVTGGVGQLGTQYVKSLLAVGVKVAVFDITINKLNDFYIAKKSDKNLLLCKVDITQKESIDNGLKSVIKKYGIPSILINNAALDSSPDASLDNNCPFEVYPEKLLDQIYAVNLKGAILCCQVIGKIMAENKGGSIINISSLYGNVSPDQRMYEYRKRGNKKFCKPVSYAVTKAAIINLSRYLATYWAEKNVRVNTLSLGGVFNNQDKKFLEEYSKRVPIGRMARKDEYNGAILFLASDASSYMTGSNVIIDGGFTAW